MRPDAYDAAYYLESCIGAEEWRESGGASVKGFYHGMLDLAGFAPECALLDIGTGRGDLIRAALERGASVAVGVDYSPDAVTLGQRTLADGGYEGRGQVLLADARALPVADARFDLATMLDVVEHLTASELAAALAEARRTLRPGGRLYVHTAPNRLVYDVTYAVQRALRRRRRREWPAEPRNELELSMHVNEQTPGSLRRALTAAGFVRVRVRLGRWIHTEFVHDPGAARTYRIAARVPLLRRFAIFDLHAEAVNPPP